MPSGGRVLMPVRAAVRERAAVRSRRVPARPRRPARPHHPRRDLPPPRPRLGQKWDIHGTHRSPVPLAAQGPRSQSAAMMLGLRQSYWPPLARCELWDDAPQCPAYD
jgi:hypothetical protein